MSTPSFVERIETLEKQLAEAMDYHFSSINTFMKRLQQIILECNESEIDSLLKTQGFGNKRTGEDKHVTFDHKDSKKNQFLIDYDGKEWHHMKDGVAKKVGKLNPDGIGELKDYLQKT